MQLTANGEQVHERDETKQVNHMNEVTIARLQAEAETQKAFYSRLK